MRIVLIEPSTADARWFQLVIEEMRVDCALTMLPSILDATGTMRPEEEFCGDLVVLSTHMPFLGATEAIARLRKLECLRQARIVVAVSSEAEKEFVEGADEFLTKPVDALQLERMLGYRPRS